MRTTPAQRHFLKMSAALESADAEAGSSLAGSSKYELMLAKLDTDKRRLKEIQSIERKIEIKREILPEYEEWISGALEGGKGAQDDVLVTIMVWLLDVGNYSKALPIIEYVIAHQLVMPDQYDRNLQTVIVDEVSDAALKAQKEGQSFDVEVLNVIRSITDPLDMPDPARSKLYKAIGFELYENAEYTEALERFQRALELNERSGVKRYIADIEKELAKEA
ncbi:MAG: terminase [Alcaligenaceae bacterium]|nr:terminase [Alcaligenaceae bacterium]